MNAMILGLIGLFAFSTVAYANPIVFTGAPNFTVAPNENGAGVLNILPTPGGGLQLQLTPNGFKFTNTILSYTAVAVDVGNQIIIDWEIQRAFNVVGAPFVGNTVAALGGTVAIGGGVLADVNNIFQRTDVVGIGIASASTANVAGPLLGPGFADGPNGSPLFNLAVGTVDNLRQFGEIRFTPSALGVYEFVLPGSFDSAIVPEPSTILLFGTGLVSLVWLRRKKQFMKA